MPTDLSTMTTLDFEKCIKLAFDEATKTFKINLQAAVTGGVETIISKNDDSIKAYAGSGILTDRSGTIASGSVAQQIMAANAARQYLIFQNHSDTDMWINFTSDAVANQPSMKILAGGTFVMEGSFVSTEKLTVICASSGKAYTAKEG